MNGKEQNSIDALIKVLLGDAEREGFIFDMRRFKDKTQDDLTMINFRIAELKQDVKPLINLMSHWKFISGVVVGLVSFLLAVVSLIWYFINTKP